MNRFILPLFWATLGVFIILMVTMFAPLRLPMGFVPFLFPSVQALFFILGLALLILSIRAKLDRMLKKFLILTGASAVGMAGSQFLHNLVFGLFIQLFGADFWDRIGIGDEPVFFMLAVFVCPLAYLVGAVGSIVLMVRRRSSSNKYS